MTVLLLFPNNLFEISYLPPGVIYLIEHPIFFGIGKTKYNYNKLKIVYHRASLQYYRDYLVGKGRTVHYVAYKVAKATIMRLKKRKCVAFDPVNRELYGILRGVTLLSNPNFLLRELPEPGRFKSHRAFFEYVKVELGILEGVRSTDAENRHKIPRGLKLPRDPPIISNKYIVEAKRFTNKHFPHNCGSVDGLIFPITHAGAKKWLTKFIRERFGKFGRYQDAMVEGHLVLYHSAISPMMNLGLINPDYVLKRILSVKRANINNVEAFIRQVAGWREYQRYCYFFVEDKNHFGHHKRMSRAWYEGTTGIKIVDDTIKMAFKYGYLHHILRLMVMSNIMNLCEIDPKDCHKWFMEFSLDSYEWVMQQNVYSMGQWSDGGMTMRKPYISSSNYIAKMSNYGRSDIWDALFHRFVKANKGIPYSAGKIVKAEGLPEFIARCTERAV